MCLGVKIQDYIKVILKLRYMFRLQWSHLQAKCLRNEIVSGIQMLGVSVRNMMAVTVEMETVTLTGEGS
jgi:hypothetical protein